MNSTRRVLVTIGWQAHLAPLVTCVLVYSCGTVEAQTERVRSSHFDDVGFAISFSPDGRTVAVARGSRDGTDQFAGVELWNAQTGELLHTIRGFDGPVWSISFSPDSKLFVTGSTEYSSRQIQQKGPAERFVELKWWDTDSGDLKRKITIPGEWRVSLAATYSPDGRTLATVECYRDPLRRRNLAVASIFEPFPRPSIASGLVIKLVEEQTGLVRRKLEGGFKDVPPGRIHSAVFSQAGQLVSAWVSDKLVTWKTDTGEKVYTVKGFKGRLSALAVSPDGRSLAAGVSLNSGRDAKPNRSSEIRLYEVTTGNLSRTIPVQTNLISSLVYAGNGEQVLVGGLRQLANRSSAVMELVNLQTGSVGAFQGQPEETISSLALSPDGSKLALPLSVFSVGVWSTRTWKLELTLNATEGGNVSRR